VFLALTGKTLARAVTCVCSTDWQDIGEGGDEAHTVFVALPGKTLARAVTSVCGTDWQNVGKSGDVCL
jgi:hypothetical protein